jgi:hypothetical protein
MVGVIGCIKLRHNNNLQINPSNILNRTQLLKIKCKALRAGVWFKALPRIDRVLVDLTIQVAENIRSAFLAKSIFAVVGKLEALLESRFMCLARTIGQTLAEKASTVAQSWGNLAAKAWSTDRSFALYFAIIQANK